MHSRILVIFGQKGLNSGKCCNRAKVVVFGKAVLFGQNGCIWTKVVVFK